MWKRVKLATNWYKFILERMTYRWAKHNAIHLKYRRPNTRRAATRSPFTVTRNCRYWSHCMINSNFISMFYCCVVEHTTTTTQPQHNRNTTATQPQHNNTTTTPQQHHNHNTTTTQPQHNHNTTQPQHNRNTTVQLLCCCCVVVVLWLWCCCGFCGRWPFYATVLIRRFLVPQREHLQRSSYKRKFF